MVIWVGLMLGRAGKSQYGEVRLALAWAQPNLPPIHYVGTHKVRGGRALTHRDDAYYPGDGA